jgi:hypothetical protein
VIKEEEEEEEEIVWTSGEHGEIVPKEIIQKNVWEEIPYLDQMQVAKFITLNIRINCEIVRFIQNRVQIMSPVDRLINILSP